MRKNKLIELLNNIDGNPEIVLWNGYAGDYMDIGGLVEGHLVKQTLTHYLEMCRIRRCLEFNDVGYKLSQDEINYLTKQYKNNFEWESNSYVTYDDILEKRYKEKRVIYLDPKLRNKTSFDRAGSFHY